MACYTLHDSKLSILYLPTSNIEGAVPLSILLTSPHFFTGKSFSKNYDILQNVAKSVKVITKKLKQKGKSCTEKNYNTQSKAGYTLIVSRFSACSYTIL